MNLWQRLLVVAGVSATPFAVGAIVWALTVPDKGTTSTFGRTLAITNTNTSTSATNRIFNTGVYGAAAKYGLHGLSTAPSGNSNGVGVFGTTKNGLGIGVRGQAGNGVTATNGVFPTGVYGQAGRYGVFGISSAPSGNANGVGVYGTTQNGIGYGVYGQTVNGYGVYGISTGGVGTYGEAQSYGVWGNNTNTTHDIDTGAGSGVYGTGPIGVYGKATGGFGVYGIGNNSGGVWGKSESYLGVYGSSTSSIGVYGSSINGNSGYFWGGIAGGGACLYDGGPDWICTSDRALKENFRSVNSVQILKQLATLPLQQWTMKGAKQKEYHLGPTAQDFQKAFGFGVEDIKVPEDKGSGAKGIKNPNAGKVIKGINRADVVGVALVSIQGLYKLTQGQRAELEQQLLALQEQSKQKDAEIAQLKQQKDLEIAQLKQQVASLQTQLDTRIAALEKQIAVRQTPTNLAQASVLHSAK
uniref:Peptidase S74 domain-containing protein n=1 Tax=Cyanothece sp. (strain PCC 7425 / ATCC 29141) TaxID=395961 RepID=B8HQS6_CYAP4